MHPFFSSNEYTNEIRLCARIFFFSHHWNAEYAEITTTSYGNKFLHIFLPKNIPDIIFHCDSFDFPKTHASLWFKFTKLSRISDRVQCQLSWLATFTEMYASEKKWYFFCQIKLSWKTKSLSIDTKHKEYFCKHKYALHRTIYLHMAVV